jgi:acyl-CoA synthetase (AMP-forming)/AMP-acid ligase II
MFLHEIVSDAAASVPEAPASWADGTWRTFAELHDRVERVARTLQQLASPGDRIAMVGENCQAWIDCYYGVPRAGMVLTPINHRLTAGEQADLLALAEPAAVIGGPHATINLDEWDDVLKDAPEPSNDGPTADTDPAWLLFTSGTTGQPKGALLTHRSILAAVRATAWGRPVADDDVFATAFPLCHVAGYTVLVFHANQRPAAVLRGFRADEFANTIRDLAVTTVSLAPTMLVSLLDHLDESGAELPSLRRITYGAAPIPPAVRRRAEDRLRVSFTEGYGMTELSGNAVFDGQPSPYVAIELAPDGEILVRGDQVTAGYWRDDSATREAFAGGWFHTGDVGEWDDDGRLHVVDRSKDVIITGGENVASREVEDVLHEHPAITAAAVVGVPDAYWGEAIAAAVVVRPDAALTEDDVVAHVAAHLAGFKKPRHVMFVDALPVNAAGKVVKAELRKRFR